MVRHPWRRSWSHLTIAFLDVNINYASYIVVYFHTYRNLPYPITSAVCRFLHPLSVPIRMHSRSGFDLHYYLICLFLCLSFVTVPQSPFYLYGKSQPWIHLRHIFPQNPCPGSRCVKAGRNPWSTGLLPNVPWYHLQSSDYSDQTWCRL